MGAPVLDHRWHHACIVLAGEVVPRGVFIVGVALALCTQAGTVIGARTSQHARARCRRNSRYQMAPWIVICSSGVMMLSKSWVLELLGDFSSQYPPAGQSDGVPWSAPE